MSHLVLHPAESVTLIELCCCEYSYYGDWLDPFDEIDESNSDEN
jgi:hypothetical protein